MLILKRKIDESIIINTPSGETIEFTIVNTKGSVSTVGVDAPEDYLILRDELVEENEFIEA